MLLLFHLAQEEEGCGDEGGYVVAEDPGEVGQGFGEAAGEDCALHFYGVDKGEGVGDSAECAADLLEVEPSA